MFNKIFIAIFLSFFISMCSSVENATKGETDTMDEDTSLASNVANKYLFNLDSNISEKGVIVEVSIDSNTFKFLEDTLGQSLPTIGKHKVACIKRVDLTNLSSLDSTIYLPINLPAKYMDSTLLNNYVQITANTMIYKIPNYGFLTIVKLNAISDYELSNLLTR